MKNHYFPVLSGLLSTKGYFSMDKLTLVKEWLRLAKDDLEVARTLSNLYPLKIEIICYHCQQSAEKALKGYLVEKDINPPKSHDLEELVKQCLKYHSGFENLMEECLTLTDYGVSVRYPAELGITESDMTEAIQFAEAIMLFVEEVIHP